MMFALSPVCVYVQMTLSEMQQKEVDLQAQIKEQCEDYQQLLSEKMARDLEILAYRSLGFVFLFFVFYHLISKRLINSFSIFLKYMVHSKLKKDRVNL